MFDKTLRTFIKELGKLNPKHRKVYKSPKKFKTVTALKYIDFVHSSKTQFLERDTQWFSTLCTETGFPILCNGSCYANSLDIIWNHIYTLYISAMKGVEPGIVEYLQSPDTVEIPKGKEDMFGFSRKIYEELTMTPGLSGLSNLPGLSGLPGIPGSIQSLAMDIAKDLQNDDSMKKFAEQNQDLLNNPGNLQHLMKNMATNSSIQDLFATVSSKIQTKIDKNEIDPEQIAMQADSFLKSMNVEPLLNQLKKNNHST